jgi:hypothetical protein
VALFLSLFAINSQKKSIFSIKPGTCSLDIGICLWDHFDTFQPVCAVWWAQEPSI